MGELLTMKRISPLASTLMRVGIIVALLGGMTTKAHAGLTFDLADDWSDAGNPNGVWRYNASPGVALTNHFANYDPGRGYFTNLQPAYAYVQFGNFGHIPAFLKAVSTAVDARHDLPLGHVYMHNNDPGNSPPGLANQPAGVSWTAPVDGDIEITGGMWQVQRYLGRIQDWSLKVNGVAVSSGTLTFTNGTSAAPLSLASGSGGSAALSRSVRAGDLLSLEFTRATGQPFGTFMGIDLHIELVQPAAVPEPSTLVLCGVGLAVLGSARLRRRVRGA